MSSENKVAADWQELLRISQGAPLVVERVSIPEKGIAVEGAFALPQLSRLSLEDQVFVTAFVRSHGSIKEMEQVFGVSYPTIKSRLNRIASQLEFVELDAAPSPAEARGEVRSDVLERLNRGEITAQDAIQALEQLK